MISIDPSGRRRVTLTDLTIGEKRRLRRAARGKKPAPTPTPAPSAENQPTDHTTGPDGPDEAA